MVILARAARAQAGVEVKYVCDECGREEYKPWGEQGHRDSRVSYPLLCGGNIFPLSINLFAGLEDE